MGKESIKYYYLQGPNGRVLTIAYTLRQQDVVCFGLAMNKYHPASHLQLDQRLRFILDENSFRELQREFIARFRGDQHDKRIGRAIAEGRVRKCPLMADVAEGEWPVVSILRMLGEMAKTDSVLKKWDWKLKTELLRLHERKKQANDKQLHR